MSAQLSERQREFLAERRFGILATINADGTPQQSVIWYELDGDEIVMNTKRGRLKDRNLVRDPRCSLCVEDELTWVAISGTAILIADQAIAQLDIERIATRYDGPEVAAQQMRDQFSLEERVTIRLRIERVVGEHL
jgi:PPOX class probable F420-dependent enzyme